MRLGIFGGSFDPIHYGHLRLAEEAREALALDRVLFVPNQVSPFKTGNGVTDGRIRAEMVQQAIADQPAFALWDGELEREGPSYTVETLRTLAAQHPDAERFFLTGTDAVRDLPKWREPETILRLAVFVAATRPGVSPDAVRDALPEAWRERVRFLPLTPLEISSTDIRNRVAHGRSIRYLTPPPVVAAIAARRLYAPGEPT